MDLLREHRGPPETHPNQWNPDAGQHDIDTVTCCRIKKDIAETDVTIQPLQKRGLEVSKTNRASYNMLESSLQLKVYSS